MKGRRMYRVENLLTSSMDRAFARAVALAVRSRKGVSVDTLVRGDAVERVTVTATLEIDPMGQEVGHA